MTEAGSAPGSARSLRPLVHAGLAGLALCGPALGKWGMAGGAAGAFLVNLLILPRSAFGSALRREGESRWNGLVAYPLAVALAYALFHPTFAAISWAVMAFGDPAAAAVGAGRKGGPRIPWNRRKSVAGSAAFLIAAWLGSFGLLCALGRMEGWQGVPPAFLVVAGGAALVGTIVESLPIPGEDNLPVVLITAASLTLAIPVF